MTWVCSRCGQSNSEGSGFCGFCGARVVLSPVRQDSPDMSSVVSLRRKVIEDIEMRRFTDRRVSTAWAALPLLLILSSVGIYLVFLLSYFINIEIDGDMDSYDLYALFYVFGRNMLSILFGLLLGLVMYRLINRLSMHAKREESLRADLMAFLRASARAGGKEPEIMDELLRMSAFDGQAMTYERRLPARRWAWGIALLFLIGSLMQVGISARLYLEDHYLFDSNLGFVFFVLMSYGFYIVAIVGVVFMFYLCSQLTNSAYTHEQRWNGFVSSAHLIFKRVGLALHAPLYEPVLKERSVAMYALLTVVTLGFFGMYWIYVLVKDPNNHFERQSYFEDKLISTIAGAH